MSVAAFVCEISVVLFALYFAHGSLRPCQIQHICVSVYT